MQVTAPGPRKTRFRIAIYPFNPYTGRTDSRAYGSFRAENDETVPWIMAPAAQTGDLSSAGLSGSGGYNA
jgi:hypothetical protein